ncbi:MAG: IS21 family transposase [Chloroflexota bacterium]|nr:IS21 family transposase [Chloroflexota bacterium]
MQEIIDIVYRLRKGQSQRTVAAALGYHRATVRRYYEVSQQRGFLDPETPFPDTAELLAAMGEPGPPPRPISTVEPYAGLVEAWLTTGVEVRAIHRLLTEQHGYYGSYSAVRRFASAFRPTVVEACVRVETAPGEEAQIDFGTVGKLLDPVTGALRVAYCFVMTLCYSRHQYVEFVLDQTIPTWIGCHKRAFIHFGGAVDRLVIDNLKAAVIKAALEDAVLGAAYRKMARHYDVLIAPCRPRTPEHKGKVESGIHFVQRNLWPGLSGKTLTSANAAAREWVMGYAGHRDHGTTHKQPLAHFLDVEAITLLPLPREPFDLLEIRQALVHRDCHVVLHGSYYPAPFEYVGQKLEVHLHEATVQLYHQDKLLATHPRARERGERIPRPDFYPPHKARYLARTKSACVEEAIGIGPACAEVAQALLDDRPKDARRALAALVGLSDRYTPARVEAACKRALAWADPRYTRVRNILRDDLDDAALPGSEKPVSEPSAATPVYRYTRGAEEFFGDLAGATREMQPC